MASSVTLSQTLGAPFLGTIFSSILFGVTVVQSYIYFRSNNKDRPWLRRTIWFLLGLDAGHTAFVVHASWFYLISSFGNINATNSLVWSIYGLEFMTVITDAIVRSIFARRVWILSRKSVVLLVFMSITIVGSFGLAFATLFNLAVHLPSLTFGRFSELSYLLIPAFAAGTAADIIIATSLCLALARKRTGIKSTDSLINVLITYSIETCLLTSIFLAACMTTYLVTPGKPIFFGVYLPYGKLSFNSLLASLNNRKSLSANFRHEVTDFRISDLTDTLSRQPRSNRDGSIVVAIDKSVVVGDTELGTIKSSSSSNVQQQQSPK